jgi:NAD(P)H-hydrate repair Nnr-like enzyme with NAD(P)H-hydrate dehydratase domain
MSSLSAATRHGRRDRLCGEAALRVGAGLVSVATRGGTSLRSTRRGRN